MYVHCFGCKIQDLMFSKLGDNLFKFHYGDKYFICSQNDKGWMVREDANVVIENDRLAIKRKFKRELENMLLDEVELIPITNDELDDALSNDLINNWEHNFCKEVSEVVNPSKKQCHRFNIIVKQIKDPSEDKVSENRNANIIASRLEIDSDSVDAAAFDGVRDAKIYSTWFRKCEKCNKIKNKEQCYRSEWRKNRKRRSGGQVVYNSRCTQCEHEVGIKWGNN